MAGMAKENVMTDSNVEVAVSAVETCAVRQDKVARMIGEGVAMASSALAIIRDAAVEFTMDVNPMGLTTQLLPDVVKKAKDLYRDDFAGDHNALAYFGDVVLTSMAGTMPISFEKTVTVDGKKVKQEIHTTGDDAVKMSKHDVRSAAKAVREQIGTSRASGGGRAPQTPSKPVDVFSLVEFKKQLDGLFSHSGGAVQVVRDNLAGYGVEVLLTTELHDLRAELAEAKKEIAKLRRAATVAKKKTK